MKKTVNIILFTFMLLTSCNKNEIYAFNKIRSIDNYNEDVARRMNQSLWESSVAFLYSFGQNNSVFSPLSLFDLSGVSAQLTTDVPNELLRSIHYTSIEDLDNDLMAYRKYFTFGEEKNSYKSRMSSMASLPDGLEYKKDISSLEEKYQIEFLKNGTEKYLNEELNYIKQATFGLMNKRWSTDSFFSLSSSIAYTAPFDEIQNVLWSKVRFNDNEVDGFKVSLQTKYYSNTKFSAVVLPLKNEKLVFFLPNKDVTLDSLFSFENFVTVFNNMENKKVNISGPNIDILSENNLTDSKLSTRIALADSLLKVKKMDKILSSEALESILPPIRVVQQIMFELDYEGVKAAASTTIDYPTSSAPVEPEVEFVMDRPFVFTLVDTYNNPLFIGTLNTVTK